MMFSVLTAHAEAWFKELGIDADHEYHKAVTAFLGWVSDEKAKDEAAIARLLAKGATITWSGAAAQATPAPVAAE